MSTGSTISAYRHVRCRLRFTQRQLNLEFGLGVHAGLDLQRDAKILKIDLAYRYLNYGSVTDTIDCIGGCNADSYKLQNLTSHDFMLGMRWRFPLEPGRCDGASRSVHGIRSRCCAAADHAAAAICTARVYQPQPPALEPRLMLPASWLPQRRR